MTLCVDDLDRAPCVPGVHVACALRANQRWRPGNGREIAVETGEAAAMSRREPLFARALWAILQLEWNMLPARDCSLFGDQNVHMPKPSACFRANGQPTPEGGAVEDPDVRTTSQGVNRPSRTRRNGGLVFAREMSGRCYSV